MSLVPDGTPLVLLNAFPVDRAQWEPLLAALDAVPGDIITFDVPGIGDMPLPDDEPSLELIADAAVLAMREVTGKERAAWVGCSMGGYVAMAVAERHPEAVAGLGLIGTKSTADTDEAREGRLALAESLEDAPGHPDPRAAAEPLLGTVGEGREALVEAVAANIGRHRGDGIAWGQRAMAARPDRTAVLAGLDVPAFVAVGEHDGFTGPDAAAVMARALGVTPTVIPGAGHLAAFEAPEAVAPLVADLLARV
ncbi:alpha/beta fold hydrolase [Demequina pelophila]|uniref:alpha/beta fold hydrolase n=1 Tax=Demequina pelophila TaxID=1638984 RepID=UPI00078064C0|nr:alpha/beta hydrolase [Demequina pelophila]